MRSLLILFGAVVIAVVIAAAVPSAWSESPKWAAKAKTPAAPTVVRTLKPPLFPPPKRGGWPRARPPVVVGTPQPKRSFSVTVRVLPAPPHADHLVLEQNFPNPCIASTTIRYTVPRRGMCTIAVFNVTGQRVATLVNGTQEAGEYSLQWDARDNRSVRLRAGVYFYRAITDAATLSRKIIIQ